MIFETKTFLITSVEEYKTLNKAYLIVKEVVSHLDKKEITELFDENNGNIIDLQKLNVTLETLDALANEELTF